MLDGDVDPARFGHSSDLRSCSPRPEVAPADELRNPSAVAEPDELRLVLRGSADEARERPASGDASERPGDSAQQGFELARGRARQASEIGYRQLARLDQVPVERDVDGIGVLRAPARSAPSPVWIPA